jgi:hypothetical protein
MPIAVTVSSRMMLAARICFLHVSALQAAAIDPDNIRKGERRTFDVESTREGKTRAANVRRPG